MKSPIRNLRRRTLKDARAALTAPPSRAPRGRIQRRTRSRGRERANARVRSAKGNYSPRLNTRAREKVRRARRARRVEMRFGNPGRTVGNEPVVEGTVALGGRERAREGWRWIRTRRNVRGVICACFARADDLAGASATPREHIPNRWSVRLDFGGGGFWKFS